MKNKNRKKRRRYYTQKTSIEIIENYRESVSFLPMKQRIAVTGTVTATATMCLHLYILFCVSVYDFWVAELKCNKIQKTEDRRLINFEFCFVFLINFHSIRMR